MEWGPCVYLWVAAPFFYLYIHRSMTRTPIPLSRINVAKGTTSVLIAAISVLLLVLQQHDGYGCRPHVTVTSQEYAATAFKIATFMLTIGLQQLMRMRGLHTSGVPFVFWLLLIGCEVIPLYIHAHSQTICSELLVFCAYFILLCVQLVFHCFSEQPPRGEYCNIESENSCPEESASILNRITFHWFTPVVWRSYRGTLNDYKFWDQTSELKAQKLAPQLEVAWQQEIDRCRRNAQPGGCKLFLDKRRDANDEKTHLTINNTQRAETYTQGREDVPLVKAGLYRTLFKVFFLLWLEGAMFMVLGETIHLLQPIVLRYIIQTKVAEMGTGQEEPKENWYLYSAFLFLVLTTSSMFKRIAFFHMMKLGVRMKTALICLIYKKALTMKRSGTNSSTVGEIVNLMSVDCERILLALYYSSDIILVFIIVSITVVQFWDIMGIASFGGLAMILVILPTIGLVGRKQYTLQRELLYLKGHRLKVLNEVLTGIKVLKMYAWEPSFIKKIQEIRSKEATLLWKYATFMATSTLMAVHSPFMVYFVLVLIYVLTSSTHALGAVEAFTALSIANLLAQFITRYPNFISGTLQAYVSVERIQEYLRSEELDAGSVQRESGAGKNGHPITIQDGVFTWTSDSTVILRNINLEIDPGELIAIVGPVGCGKSSLISACLGEMTRLQGRVNVQGKLAYVPQVSWIQNMSLRNNILFGEVYNEKKYSKIIDACALRPDLQTLPGGDLTEIGEKGINISGGQKQRVSLARAVYNEADVYFLDDPLSAVDSHVGKHLFQNVIGNQGLLKHKTRVLVTHGVHWLPMVDRIVVMKDGEISEMGSYDELTSHHGAFTQFLEQSEEEMVDDDSGRVWDWDSDYGYDTTMATHGKGDRRRSTTEGEITSDEDIRATSAKKRRRLRKSQQKSEMKMETFDELKQLTVEDTSEKGAIKPAVLMAVVNGMGRIAFLIVFVFLSLFQGLNIYSNFWLSFWTEDQLLKNVTIVGTPEYSARWQSYLLIYLLLGALQGICLFSSFYLLLTRLVKASNTIHNNMLRSVLRSPMHFFDTTPIGRIMNRFSANIDILDIVLPEGFQNVAISIFSALAVVIVEAINTPFFIIAIVPITAIYIYFMKFYLPTAREMKRADVVSSSPIFNLFSETITGASVIRSFDCSQRFVDESKKLVDENARFIYASRTGSRWVCLRAEMLGNVFVLLAAIFALTSDRLNSSQVGLSIMYAVQLAVTLNLLVISMTKMERTIISAEKIMQYTNILPEAEWSLEQSRPPKYWPSTGKIEFHNYSTRYREGLDLVLKGINCTIADGEKVGVVGRTGAGKSSLMLCLFRLIEPVGGSIVIDGLNIAELGLHDLRTKLTILPQDPVIFSGTLRANLDPFGCYSDECMWHALESAHLKAFVSGLDEGLSHQCGEGGQNLSVGQRQLVCLARTLLHKTKVLILDEATAAVDIDTDDLIQETIRTQFKDCTVITVAHRINTIMDYDRIMVLDSGVIKEFDTPQLLLQNEAGAFYKMAKDANII